MDRYRSIWRLGVRPLVLVVVPLTVLACGDTGPVLSESPTQLLVPAETDVIPVITEPPPDADCQSVATIEGIPIVGLDSLPAPVEVIHARVVAQAAMQCVPPVVPTYLPADLEWKLVVFDRIDENGRPITTRTPDAMVSMGLYGANPIASYSILLDYTVSSAAMEVPAADIAAGGYELHPELVGPLGAPVYFTVSEEDVLLNTRAGNLVVSLSINRGCETGPAEGAFRHICLSYEEINNVFSGLSVLEVAP